MPSLNSAREAAYQGQDTTDFLSHIGWTDVIVPKINLVREQYITMLINSTLGTPIVIKNSAGGDASLSREQLAGRIHGIDFVLDLLKKLVINGDKAEEWLRTQGISI